MIVVREPWNQAVPLPRLLDMMGRPIEAKHRNVWVLQTPIRFEVDGVSYVIRENALTDMASAPWWTHWFITPHAWQWLTAAAIHDHGYAGLAPSRREADRWFRDVALAFGAQPWAAKVAYRGLRLGGRDAWRINQRRLETLGPGHRYLR